MRMLDLFIFCIFRIRVFDAFKKTENVKFEEAYTIWNEDSNISREEVQAVSLYLFPSIFYVLWLSPPLSTFDYFFHIYVIIIFTVII